MWCLPVVEMYLSETLVVSWVLLKQFLNSTVAACKFTRVCYIYVCPENCILLYRTGVREVRVRGSTDPLKFEIGVKKLTPCLCRTCDFWPWPPLLKNGSRAPGIGWYAIKRTYMWFAVYNEFCFTSVWITLRVHWGLRTHHSASR